MNDVHASCVVRNSDLSSKAAEFIAGGFLVGESGGLDWNAKNPESV
ncbi:hypothetical protein OAH18_02975 [bacterium]|nr:hypothetical protein [bacterium]